MIKALTMPAWGMEDGAGTVVNWLVQEGDVLETGQDLVEIETTKLTNVVESPFVGTLKKIVLTTGDTAPPGSLLAVVVEGEASAEEIDAFVAENSQVLAAPAEKHPEERSIETPLGKVRVTSIEGGDASPVVLLHGYGADWTSWSMVMRPLAETRTVMALDLPGHGGSFKELGPDPIGALVDAVVAVVREVGRPVNIVGHSLGGLVAAKVAARAPEAIATVTLIAPAGLGATVEGRFLETFADSDGRKNARAALEMLVADRDSISLAMINDVIRARRVEGAKEALHALRAELADNDRQRIALGEEIGSLAMPVQVIVAAEDKIVSSEAAAGLANVSVIENAGHLVHMERSGEVQKKIEAFIGGNK